MIAQLRDMVAAENSSIVAQEDKHRGSCLPKGTEADFPTVWIRESNWGKSCTQSVSTHQRYDTVKCQVPIAVVRTKAGFRNRLTPNRKGVETGRERT